MKITLDVMERSTVLKLLPKEGNVLTLKIIRNLVQKVGITSEEFKEFEIKTLTNDKGDTYSQWNMKGTVQKEFELSQPEADILKAELLKLDKAGKLDKYSVLVYEKFFP